MPMIQSFADVLRDWELLIAAANDNAEALAPAESQKAALEAALAEARSLKGRQESMGANRQQATQELRALVARGHEEARRLRGMVKGLLGTKNERLVQFRVAPLRKRSSAKAKVPVEKPAEPEQALTTGN